MFIAFTFRCRERQFDICISMTTPRQLDIVRREIADIKAEMLKTKEALAATQKTRDVDALRKQLEDLRKEKIILREQETILLQGQASGEHRLPCYLLPRLAELHAHLFHVLIPSRPQTTRSVLSVLYLV